MAFASLKAAKYALRSNALAKIALKKKFSNEEGFPVIMATRSN